MGQYIWQCDGWPQYTYNMEELWPLLLDVSRVQGELCGLMANLGMAEKAEQALELISAEVTQSSAIEGVVLEEQRVRSSVANHLGLYRHDLSEPDHYTDSVVQITINAIKNCKQELTKERLFGF